MKYFIGGYEVSAETKAKYEAERSHVLADQLRHIEAIRHALKRPCRKGWNILCDCTGECER